MQGHHGIGPPTSNPNLAAKSSIRPQLTFTQGLLVGQLSIICVVIALIRYLLLEDTSATPTDDGAIDGKDNKEGVKRRHFPQSSMQSRSGQTVTSLLSLSLSSVPPRATSPPPGNAGTESVAGSGPSLAALARIPDAVGYDMETASDVDVGWLNVLVAHVWEGYRDDFLAGGSEKPEPTSIQTDFDDDEWDDVDKDRNINGSAEQDMGNTQRSARDFMQEILNRPKEEGKVTFLDAFEVTECLLGNSYPILSNARVRPRDDQGRVRVEVEVDYTDLLSLSLRTAILVNWPRERFAVLPTSLGLRITRFSGTLSLSFTSYPPSQTPVANRSRHSLEVSLHPDFLLLATCSSLVGSRTKLQDIPKIQQLVLQRIRQAILDKFGWPRSWTVEMPDLVRRRPKRRRRRLNQGVGHLEGEDGHVYMEDIAEEDADGGSLQEGWHCGLQGSQLSRATTNGNGYYRNSKASAPGGFHTHRGANDDGLYDPVLDAQRIPKASQRQIMAAAGRAGSRGLAGRQSQPKGTRRGYRSNGMPSITSLENSFFSEGPSGSEIARSGMGAQRPAYHPAPFSSQFTSISRRGLNHRRYTNGYDASQGLYAPRTTTHDGRMAAATAPQHSRSRPPSVVVMGATSTGVDPAVEAWRKEMVRRTHGGTPEQ